MTVPLCYYGSPDPLPERRELRAGPLTAIYEAGDLRYVKVGGVEVCRRWYAAVRDRNWGTVPVVISDEVIEQTADGFRVTYTSTHKQGDIHFIWHAVIFGTPEEVLFTFDGEAMGEFRRNRIGFCVLHPPRECAGQRVLLNGRDKSQFPDAIAPWNPFKDLQQLSHTVAGGDWVHWHFEGDLFETEDQRNWIDASFKTFCTPLRLPFPVEVKAGEQIRQKVSMSMIGGGQASAAPLTLTRRDSSWTRMPDVGLGVATHGKMLAPAEVELLDDLRPAHLRAEVDLTRPGWDDELRRATTQSREIGCGVELALTVSDGVVAETADLPGALADTGQRVDCVLVVHAGTWATNGQVVGPVVEAFARAGFHPKVFGGTTANFTELNRNRPPLDWVEGVCYSVQPQEHAFDNSSLVECCATIADTARTARSFSADKPIAVGPITLRKQVNPYATGPWEPPAPDPRQGSLFGAAWTLGALKYLAESGVASATFYETTGPRGVMDGGRVFPLFHVLADASEWAGASVVKCESSDPLTFDALLVKADDRTGVLLANMTAEPQTVNVDWPFGSQAAVRALDETTVEFACTDPVAFRQQIGDTLPAAGGRLTLTLRPYAYVRIDG